MAECEVVEEEVVLPDGSKVRAVVVRVEVGKTLTTECRDRLGGRGG
jgi:hypothetical protein